jgi:hypothetical protein
MRKTSLMAICIAGNLSAFAAHADTLPTIPKGSELEIAGQSLVYARACDLRYKRPSMVWDSKSVFLKYATGVYPDPQAVTEQAFNDAQLKTTIAYAKASKEFTVDFCTRLAKMFKRELGR